MWASRSSGFERARKPGPHRRHDPLDLQSGVCGRPIRSVSLAGVPWWPVIAVFLLSRIDVEDVLPLLDGVGDRGHLAVEEGAVADQHVVLVGDVRRGAGAGRAAQAHGREVVHLAEGRQEGHRVAADAAVGDQVDRARARGRGACRRGRPAAGGSRSSASWCRGAGSRRSRWACAGVTARVAGGVAPGGAPRPPAPARRRGRGNASGDPSTSRPERGQRDVGVHPRGLGEAARPAREGLAPDGLAAALERPAHLVLEVAGALLHHDDLVDGSARRRTAVAVDRPGEPEAQHRHLAVEAELGEGVPQQRVGGARPRRTRRAARPRSRGPAPGGRCPPRGRRRAGAGCAARGGRPRGRWRRAAARRRRATRIAAVSSVTRLQRPDGRRAVGGQIHDAGAVGLDGRDDHADDQLALRPTGRRPAARGPSPPGRSRARAPGSARPPGSAGCRRPPGWRRGVGSSPTTTTPAAAGRRPGGVGDREPVEGDVGADALEHRHGARPGHLARAVQHRRALRLVVGQRASTPELERGRSACASQIVKTSATGEPG